MPIALTTSSSLRLVTALAAVAASLAALPPPPAAAAVDAVHWEVTPKRHRPPLFRPEYPPGDNYSTQATAWRLSERRAAVDEALSLLAEDAPVIPLLFTDGVFAYRSAVYDGWTFVKGTGVLDKRSLVEPASRNGGPEQGGTDSFTEDESGLRESSGRSGRSPLLLIAGAAILLAIVIAVYAATRGDQRSR